MKAFWIDAGYVSVCVFALDDGFGLDEDWWFGGIVYAETAAKAKSLFIKETYKDARFEYTDPMSIRVLATATNEQWTPGYAGYDDVYEGESPWMRGKRSKYGEERYQEFKGWQLKLAEEEANS